MLVAVLLVLAAYLVGAIPFGYLVARWHGIDILRQGSGNIGATNVGRVLGRKFGILVFLLDFAKGALPVTAARLLSSPPDWPPDTLPVAAGVAAFLGHLFPVYLRFRGGKGVATGAGVALMLLPLPMLAALGLWLVLVLAFRYVSLASVSAAVLLCGLRLALTPAPWSRSNLVITLFCVLAAVLVVVRHRANLQRLWLGTENRLKDTPAMLSFGKMLHVLALGLCFGTMGFFTIMGVMLFQTFEEVAVKPADERPLWFPLPPEFDKEPPRSEDGKEGRFPDPLRKEQGLRAAGWAVTPLFPWYYGLQAGCVVLALATALPWPGRCPGERIHKVRVGLLLLAVALLAVGGWLEKTVTDLRVPRNELTDAVLREPHPSDAEIEKAEQARYTFGVWHAFSLLQNFASLLVMGALVARGVAPAGRREETAGGGGEKGADGAGGRGVGIDLAFSPLLAGRGAIDCRPSGAQDKRRENIRGPPRVPGPDGPGY